MFVSQWCHKSDKFSTSEKIRHWELVGLVTSLRDKHGIVHCEVLSVLTLKVYLFWWNQVSRVYEWRHLGMASLLLIKFGWKWGVTNCTFATMFTTPYHNNCTILSLVTSYIIIITWFIYKYFSPSTKTWQNSPWCHPMRAPGDCRTVAVPPMKVFWYSSTGISAAAISAMMSLDYWYLT